MLYSFTETPIGQMAYVYMTHNRTLKAIQIMLPSSRAAIVDRISKRFPQAREGNPRNFIEMNNALQSFFKKSPKEIPMRLVDESMCKEFQLRVLCAERSIPRGRTASYGWLAKKIGSKAYRAVGNALARNPFPIVVPCHRAVRSDRTLGGFQGGIEMKRWLLEMEGVQFDKKGRVHSAHMLE